MARVLLVWELGANLGHVARIRTLARALRERGHECVFAASDLRSAEEFLDPALGPVFQAPVRQSAPRNPVRTQVSYASLLNNVGFDDVVGLASRIRAWRQLMQTSGAKLVVCDHAPTALLAAASLPMPALLFGTGFTVPPLTRPFPVFVPGMKVEPDVLSRNEAAVLENVNAALARLQLAPLACLQDLMAGAERHVLSYAELDHYDSGRSDPYLGVPDNSHGGAPAWAEGSGPRILAYLRHGPQLDTVLQALSRSRARVLLRVGDVSADRIKPHVRPGLAATDHAVHMGQAARECDAFVNYASHGFVAEMLLAGKPGLLLPDHMERSLVARRGAQLGATLSPPSQGDFNLSQALDRIVEDKAMRSAAEKFAARYAGQDRNRILESLADAIGRRLSGG